MRLTLLNYIHWYRWVFCSVSQHHALRTLGHVNIFGCFQVASMAHFQLESRKLGRKKKPSQLPDANPNPAKAPRTGPAPVIMFVSIASQGIQNFRSDKLMKIDGHMMRMKMRYHFCLQERWASRWFWAKSRLPSPTWDSPDPQVQGVVHLPSLCLFVNSEFSGLKLKVPHWLRHSSVFEEVLGDASDTGFSGGWCYLRLVLRIPYTVVTVIRISVLHLHLCWTGYGHLPPLHFCDNQQKLMDHHGKHIMQTLSPQPTALIMGCYFFSRQLRLSRWKNVTVSPLLKQTLRRSLSSASNLNVDPR